MSRYYLIVLLTVHMCSMPMDRVLAALEDFFPALGTFARAVTDDSDDELDADMIHQDVVQKDGPQYTELDLSKMPPGTQWNRIARISDVSTVRDIHLNNNAALPLDIGLHLSCARNLVCLTLSSCQLPSMPEGLTALSTLKYLDVSDNNLADIPENALPPGIYRLLADSNQFRRIPAVVKQLKKLIELRLMHNQIGTVEKDDLPPSIETLNLSSNNLQSIPRAVESLAQLETIFLGLNNIPASEITIFRAMHRECKVFD